MPQPGWYLGPVALSRQDGSANMIKATRRFSSTRIEHTAYAIGNSGYKPLVG